MTKYTTDDFASQDRRLSDAELGQVSAAAFDAAEFRASVSRLSPEERKQLRDALENQYIRAGENWPGSVQDAGKLRIVLEAQADILNEFPIAG
jgi:hypothetical protein